MKYKLKDLSQLIVILSCLVFTSFACDSCIVETKNGKLRGITQKSIEGFEFHSFLGVPYAKPPMGRLRFKVSLVLQL